MRTGYLRKKGGMREVSCMRKEKKKVRKEKKKGWHERGFLHEKRKKQVGASFFDEYPRVLAQGSGSENVSYECREPTKLWRELQQPLKYIC